jgi:hypothetical protein
MGQVPFFCLFCFLGEIIVTVLDFGDVETQKMSFYQIT